MRDFNKIPLIQQTFPTIVESHFSFTFGPDLYKIQQVLNKMFEQSKEEIFKIQKFNQSQVPAFQDGS